MTEHKSKDGVVIVTLVVEHPDLPDPIYAAVEVKPQEISLPVLVGIAQSLWGPLDKLLPKPAIIMPSRPGLEI